MVWDYLLSINLITIYCVTIYLKIYYYIEGGLFGEGNQFTIGVLCRIMLDFCLIQLLKVIHVLLLLLMVKLSYIIKLDSLSIKFPNHWLRINSSIHPLLSFHKHFLLYFLQWPPYKRTCQFSCLKGL